MLATNTATIIANVYSDDPNESPPTRIAIVCSTIAAKPTNSAIAPYATAAPGGSRGAGPVSSTASSRRRAPSSANSAPAAMFTQPIRCRMPSRPSQRISTNPVASAPANAPAVFVA